MTLAAWGEDRLRFRLRFRLGLSQVREKIKLSQLSGFEAFGKSSEDSSIEPALELTLFFIVHSFAMLCTVTNPILYGWLNTNLKHFFRYYIKALKQSTRDEFSLHSIILCGRSSIELLSPEMDGEWTSF